MGIIIYFFCFVFLHCSWHLILLLLLLYLHFIYCEAIRDDKICNVVARVTSCCTLSTQFKYTLGWDSFGFSAMVLFGFVFVRLFLFVCLFDFLAFAYVLFSDRHRPLLGFSIFCGKSIFSCFRFPIYLIFIINISTKYSKKGWSVAYA